MTTYLFEPRDPMVLRDGRSGENVMRTLRFPWPSSIAGMVRTRIGQDESGQWSRTPDETKELLKVSVAGSWLAKIDNDRTATRYYSVPQDAVWFKKNDTLVRYRLVPQASRNSEKTNLPEGLELLQPIEKLPVGKPESPPEFVSEAAMMEWLVKPKAEIGKCNYLDSLAVENRIHVKIHAERQVAEDGALFSTEGLMFTLRGSDRKIRRMGLCFATTDERLDGRCGVAHLGGEKRFGSIYSVSEKPLPDVPAIPSTARRLRMVLTTPAVFSAGYRPDDSIFEREARIVAAAVGRPQHISGWDYAAKGPKASRRMAPAGSVYWVELNEGVDANAFAEKWWMKSLCDNEQDRRDGFGVCMTGVE